MGRGGGVECKVIMNKLKNEKKRRMGSSMVALTGKSAMTDKRIYWNSYRPRAKRLQLSRLT
jgi:hypothetical protein